MNANDCMALAMELARKGTGWTSPNPLVGAVLVKDGKIIGQGWHRRCGGLHAEREALAACTEDPAGATLYVTLEPCCGRQASSWRRISCGKRVTPSIRYFSTTSPIKPPMWP